jgi:hypothetical protein
MERLREFKAAAAGKRAAGAGAGAGEPPGLSTALELAGIQPEAPPPPALLLPRKRKVADTLAALAEDSGSEGEGGSGSDSGGEEAMVDWRAKQSTG